MLFSRASQRKTRGTANLATGQKPQHGHDKHAFPQTRLSGKHGYFWTVYSLGLQIAQYENISDPTQSTFQKIEGGKKYGNNGIKTFALLSLQNKFKTHVFFKVIFFYKLDHIQVIAWFLPNQKKICQILSFDECAGDVISKSPGTFKGGKQFMISPLNENSLLFIQTWCLKTILIWPTENEIILFISTKELFIPKQSCNIFSFHIDCEIWKYPCSNLLKWSFLSHYNILPFSGFADYSSVHDFHIYGNVSVPTQRAECENKDMFGRSWNWVLSSRK